MPKHSNSKRQSPRKPEMERKRRRRINDCLNEIKQLIPEAKELEIKKGCRLEKAEILEITVDFIRRMNSKLSADIVQTTIPSGTSSVEFREEGLSYLTPSPYPTGPLIPPKVPGCCDLPQTCCAFSEYIKPIRQTTVYPQIIRPIPRVFTPLCVSAETFDSSRDVPSCAFPKERLADRDKL
ncbi:protein deadpan-like [Montipora capricornis]|uniref:protein deadpan-like n=1 Tax=Montipora capricornis TaxID=246305 RepID=UPI0035F1A40C